ncbi:MAG TPA: hypothetical protein VN478_00025, partial [Clostridia bacterium]|nr:hypothetical protein [Clostridia bacterium]
ALERPQADLPSIRPALIGLPRLDAVIVRQQAIASLPVNTQASVLTRLVDRGTSIFVTDTPRHIAELLDDAGHDPWNSSPTQK